MKENSVPKATASHYEVLIAGGGFSGAYCAKYLAREWKGETSNRAALIADENVLAFQPMLAEVVGASLSPLDVVTPLHLFCRGTNVLQGKIVDIDLDTKTIILEAGRYTPNSSITFDHLVLAIGNVIDLSRVPGMNEHGYILKNAWDAVRLRVALIERLEEANLSTDDEARKRLLTFAVVGGGYSGVETAGQILDLVADIHPVYLNLKDVQPRVVLIHSHDRILPEIGEKLGNYAKEKLLQRGMELMLNERVASVTAGKVLLGSGKAIDTHLVVSTVGNATHPLIAGLVKKYQLENLHGRITTEPSMRVKGRTHLWAVGDCAAVPHEKEDSCPATAQFALRQGIQVSQNIVRAIKGEPLLPFHHKSQGQLASIGRRTAVADVMGVQFSGILAWFIWRTIYASKIPGLQRKLRVIIDWTLDLFFPRDISVVRPDTWEPLRSMRFETGDVVLLEESPYTMFYILKEGSLNCFRNEELVKTVGQGDHLGGPTMTAENAWTIKVVAAAPSMVVAIKREVWKTLLLSKDISQKFPVPSPTTG